MKTKILVTVSGGVVTGVYAKVKPEHQIEVVVCDYDDLECSVKTDLDRCFEDGQTVSRFFQQLELGNENYRELA